MPGLLTLRTDLKSLKYGQDQPGGGSSNQPYIQTDINNPITPLNSIVRAPFIRDVIGEEVSNNIGAFIDRFVKVDDGFIRGGILGSTNAAITDTLRISKFLIDVPKGPLFVIKQAGLQASNPRLESKRSKKRGNVGRGEISLEEVFDLAENFNASNIKGKIGNLLGPTRIYNLGLNTISQVPVNALGGHIVRHGILPIRDRSKDYINVVNHNNIAGTNRLEKLAIKLNLGPEGEAARTKTFDTNLFWDEFLSFTSIATDNLDFGVGSLLLDSKNPRTIDSYLGGPESTYGLISTTIKRSDFTNDKNKIITAISESRQYSGTTRNRKNGDIQAVQYSNDLGRGDKSISKYLSGSFASETDIKSGISNYATSDLVTNFRTSTAVTDYITLKNRIEAQQKLDTFKSGSLFVNSFGLYNTNRNDPTSINKNSGYSTSDVSPISYKNSYGEVLKISGSWSWNSISREQRVGSARKDEVNKTPIYSGDKYYGSDDVTIGGKEYQIRDLVKFRIQAVNTDSPDNGQWMAFRAYITQYSDGIDATWGDISYAGRGEKFYVYNNFTRKVNIGFKVAALSADEMKPMYQKLNFLMSNLMPDYDNILMRGPLVRMTVGNWLDSQLGVLNSLTYTINETSPWEIAIDEPESGGSSKLLILPHVVEVSLVFTPIGSEHRKENKISQKTDSISHIAQNNTGKDADTLQYIG